MVLNLYNGWLAYIKNEYWRVHLARPGDKNYYSIESSSITANGDS